MKKYNLSDNKGITLSVWVITIIVMLILAGIGIAAFAPGGLTEKTEKLKEDIPLKQVIEEVHNNLDYKYYLMTNGEVELKDALTNEKSTVEEIARISIETGISTEKFTIEVKKEKIDGKDLVINENKILLREYMLTTEEKEAVKTLSIDFIQGDHNEDGIVNEKDLEYLMFEYEDLKDSNIKYKCYDYNLATEEQVKKLEDWGYIKLIGDVKPDRKIDEYDVKLLNDFGIGDPFPTEKQNIIGDINKDGKADGQEAFILNIYLRGMMNYQGML